MRKAAILFSGVLTAACGAPDSREGPASKTAGEPAAVAPASKEAAKPELIVDQPTLVVAPPEDVAPMPAPYTDVCSEAVDLANAVRGRGEQFFSVSEAYGELAPPAWSPLVASRNEALIVDGLYDGWCEAPERVDPQTRAPFSDAERASCQEQRKSTIRTAVSGAARLEAAVVDIDRDGDAETVYQLFPDPALAGDDPAWIDFNLAPRIFVSPDADAQTHRQLHQTVFAPVASLFYRKDQLYALQPMGGSANRYQIFLITAAGGRLGQIPLCELTAPDR